MTKTPLLGRIARTAYRRRRAVVGLWIGLLIALSIFSSTIGGDLRNDLSLPGAESDDASQLLEDGGLGDRGGHTGQIVFRADEGIDDPAVRSAMETFFDDVTSEVPDIGILSPYSEQGAAQVAPDGQVAFAEVQFGDIDLDAATALADDVVDVRDAAEGALPAGLQVDLGGDLFFEEVEASSEGLGFLAAMVIMLIAFGSVLAMGLPIVTALFGIGCGIAVVTLAANLIDIPEFGPQTVMLIAIGVGIDYALLIVTRFRDELRAGREPEAAVLKAMATAGRSVFFAGATVVIALAGLLLSSLSVFRSLAVATIVGVLMVMLAALTLLPALLGFVGRNIDRWQIGSALAPTRLGRRLGSGRTLHRRKGEASPTDARSTVWYRWSRMVQRRPGPIAVVAFAGLLLMAVPVLGMRLGFSDAGNRPDTDTSRRAYDLVSDGFGPGYNGPLFLAADLPGDAAEDAAVLERLSASLDADDGIDLALPPTVNDAGDVGFVQAFPTTSPQDADTQDTVDRLRDEVVPTAAGTTSADVLVGGSPAAVVDFADIQATQLPVFIAAVLLLSFLLLLAVFRSVAVALKAVLMNMLSIGAAYGALVAVFQWGWGADLLGVGEAGPIDAWVPMMLFAILFGLSIDYEVFLLSRMKEEHDLGADNATAVADGLAKSARIITAAAAIMVCVTGAFVLSVDRQVQIFGLGLAVAIFVDAALVRTLFVPAAMELLGERNWWMPRWLDRVLPRLDIDGSTLPDAADTGLGAVVPVSSNGGSSHQPDPEPVA